MLIHSFLANSAKQYPDKVAVIHDEQRATYGQLNTQTDNFAKHLQTTGVGKGDRVALLLENSIDYVVAYYGILKAGAVAAPLNPGLKPGGLQYLVNELEPSAIVSSFKSERLLKAVQLNLPTLKQLIIRNPRQKWEKNNFNISTVEESIAKQESSTKVAVEPDDLANIIYTSGSTGEPKGVMLSHKNIVSNTNSICQYLNIEYKDIQMVVLPFFYVMGKSLLNTHIASGATVILNNRFMYPADVVHQMIKEQVTSFSGVPSTYAYLLNRSPLADSRDRLHCLRYCSQAGGHMAKSLKLALRNALPKDTGIVIMYGATEASARLTYLAPEIFESKLESIGKPIPDVTVRIMDAQNNEVDSGNEGMLVAFGPNIMQGYWKDPVGTDTVMRGRGYCTGDLGYRDDDGFLYVTGRKDGLLKVGGHRINPTEIEDFLMATNQLIETAVVGIPDQLMGNKLISIVVPKMENQDHKALMEICANGLPSHKRPADIITVRALPKNANGKIDRKACVELVRAKE